MASRVEIMKFVNNIGPKVIEVCKSKDRKILPSVCIAQACLESGYGTVKRMLDANALFGIKVGSGVRYGKAWDGSAYNTKTREVYNGKDTYIKADFRAYKTIEDSIEDYYDLLGTSSRYKKAIGQTNPRNAIMAIQMGPYSTDPTYVDKVLNIISKNNLTKFDECMNGSTTKIEDQNAANNTDAGLVHTIGEYVTITKYFPSSTSAAGMVTKTKSGFVKRVVNSAMNPYLIADRITGSLIGWTNDKYVNLNETGNIHEVQSGDTLSKIAKKYDTTINKIVTNNKKKYPDITSNFIRVGWRLTV